MRHSITIPVTIDFDTDSLNLETIKNKLSDEIYRNLDFDYSCNNFLYKELLEEMNTSNVTFTVGDKPKHLVELQETEDGEAFIELPEDVLNRLGWTLGTELKWTVKDGEVIVEKL